MPKSKLKVQQTMLPKNTQRPQYLYKKPINILYDCFGSVRHSFGLVFSSMADCFEWEKYAFAETKYRGGSVPSEHMHVKELSNLGLKKLKAILWEVS